MTNSGPIQLSLGVSLTDDATFENFYAVGNEQVVHTLQNLSSSTGSSSTLLWGAHGSGLSHLLQAACHTAGTAGHYAQYLPLAELLDYDPMDICEGLEDCHLLCLDGLESVCGNPEWERAIFHIYNNMRDAGNALVFAAYESPSELAISLPDLKSRILGCVVYQLESLTDDDKKSALKMRAQARGMDMSDDVARYIMSRVSRDFHALFQLLAKIDAASLQKQRKITIPLVRELLDESV
ncbi:MAG: DnaA family protein [Flavobacteriales bacterium]|jgi:DnaA family protein